MQVATQPPPPFHPPGGGGFNRFHHGGPRFHRPPFHHHHHHGGGRFRHSRPRQPIYVTTGGDGGPGDRVMIQPETEYDGKTLRRAVQRKTVDYSSMVVRYLESRVWQRDYRDHLAIQPDVAYCTEVLPPMHYLDNPVNAVTTRFVRTSTNKMRCPIFCVSWTPEGRRLITGASSGEFTLWNGLTFNFETILQAHDGPVRSMVWSHNGTWMVTGDTAGYVKYWQSNMNNVKMFQAHKEPCRSISFCPTDQKLVTGSDDGTVRIWDFMTCTEDRVLRGHGAEVKAVDWHPQRALIASGSKDSQQPVKLWDPKTGRSLATLHAHKSTVMDVRWNQNGNWLVTVSRDHLVKLYDIRRLGQELQTFRGHKKEVSVAAWNPVHENLLATGGSDGSILFWVVGADKEVGCIESAHDNIIWSMQWHPLGHILCSGSNDHSCKFWTRNKPGDKMRDKYNLNTLPHGMGLDEEYDDVTVAIPGMGLDHGTPSPAEPMTAAKVGGDSSIPGLDFPSRGGGGGRGGSLTGANMMPLGSMKKPHAKPINQHFQQSWFDAGPGGPPPPPDKRTLLPPPGFNDRPPNDDDRLMPPPWSGPLPPPGGPPPPRNNGFDGDIPSLLAMDMPPGGDGPGGPNRPPPPPSANQRPPWEQGEDSNRYKEENGDRGGGWEPSFEDEPPRDGDWDDRPMKRGRRDGGPPRGDHYGGGRDGGPRGGGGGGRRGGRFGRRNPGGWGNQGRGSNR